MKGSFQADSSVYLHIPFCEVKCGYCDFYSIPRGWKEFNLQEEYVASLLREIELRAPSWEGRALQSIFFGGGTPSLLRSDLLEKILNSLKRFFRWNDATEITLEANPKTVDRDQLKDFRSLGINRLSIGVQSFQDKFLQRLGRIHSGEEARRTLEEAKEAGFRNINLDLIFSLPEQTLEEWQSDLERALYFHSQHLSCYALTLESGTPFQKLYLQGGISLPSEEEEVRHFTWTRQRLAAAGLPAYEISNFARPGFESVHNRNYWNYGEYLGFGAGAASFIRANSPSLFARRAMNPPDLNAYLRGDFQVGQIALGQIALEEDPIDWEKAKGEFVMLGLRTREGVSSVRFQELFGVSFEMVFAEELERLVRAGQITSSGHHWHLTEAGLLLANEVTTDFLV